MTMLSDGMLLGAGVGTVPLSYVAAASASGNAANGDVTINKPAGTVSGDDMWAIVWDATTATGFTSSGWALVNQVMTGSNRYSILSKTAGGSEPGSYTFSNSGSLTKAGHIITTRGGTKSQTIGTLVTASGVNTVSASSISPAQAGILLAFFSHTSTSRTVSTPPSGMTQIALENTNYSAVAYILDPSSSGATGAKSITWNGTGAVGALLMQIY